MVKEKPEVFFHVGLGKVASTFLQYRFFPKLKNLCYIQRTKYRKAPRIIQKGLYDRYLVSREFDRQLPQEALWFSSYFPDAQPIILLRRHDQWIASQYRRFLKNGGQLKLEQFLDLDEDKGRWKEREVYFMPYIKVLEQYFSKPPMVFFYEEFQSAPKAFLDILAHSMNAVYDWESIDNSPFHTSYDEKQLKFMRKYGSHFFRKNKALPSNNLARWLMRRTEMLKSYFLLYSALLFPREWVADEELFSPDYLERIRKFYRDDWIACQVYAERL